MKKFKQGDKVRLRDNRADLPKTYGQGDPPNGIPIRYTKEGERHERFLEYGTLFKVSDYTQEPVASLDSNPLPLVQEDWINSREDIHNLFELVEPADND